MKKFSQALTTAALEPRILHMRLVVMPALVVMLLLTIARPTVAQALGDVAKQEAERRKAVAAAGKVYTNESLRPEAPPAGTSAAPQSGTAATAAPSSAVPTPAGQAAPVATPQGEEPAPMTEDAWRKRMTGVRDALSRAQMFAEALQTRVNSLTTDFVNRDDPAQRDAIAGERQKALAEIDRVKREIADHQKAIADIQDEARRAGVPAGWVR
jgi:hypothetical protein